MSNPQEVRWLVIGTSDIVQKRALPALVSANNSKVVGVVGGIDRANVLAQKHNIPNAWATLDEALKNSGANAAYIGTAVHRHQPEALAALKAGMHVLIEKPLALSEADGKPIVDAAAKAGKAAGCAYYRRFFPRYQLARKMIAAGEFGKITLVRIHVAGWFNPEETDPKIWRTKKSLAGGGNSMDMGCHMLDLLIHLLGMPQNVQALVGSLVQKYESDDSAAALMQLPGGAPVLADFHWNTHAGGHEFEIVGSEARLKMIPADTGPVIKTVGAETQTLTLPNAANIHLPLVQDFVDAIRENRPPGIPLDEALKVNRLLDAIYRAGQTGQMQKL